eukprot:5199685-Amphidinium_carterae.1
MYGESVHHGKGVDTLGQNRKRRRPDAGDTSTKSTQKLLTASNFSKRPSGLVQELTLPPSQSPAGWPKTHRTGRTDELTTTVK